jgi:cation diffusion facilitator family transporter
MTMSNSKTPCEASSVQALKLAYLTVGYNVVEGIASIVAAMLAGSTALLGFGADSFIESLSGSVMIWRFRKAHSLSAEDVERREHRAIRLVGLTFFILSGYVVYESVEQLYSGNPPEPSLFGILIAVASLVVMPVLFYRKHRIGEAIGSRSLMADAKQTLMCIMLSVALLVGLSLNYLCEWWQADPVAGLVIAVLLVREGYRAWGKGEACACSSLGDEE